MKMNSIAIAVVALLVGGVATAAYMNYRSHGSETVPTTAAAADAAAPATEPAPSNAIAPTGGLAYADVLAVKPVTEPRKLYATVIGVDPVRESSTTTVPREECHDVVVQERLPERDGNVGGTVVGAVVGGLIGNQVGKGSGRKLATVAGAVGGGFAGREIDKRYENGKVVDRTERQCQTVSETQRSSKVVGYNVTYRNPDGTTGSMRTGSKPGSRISLGNEDHVVGYDVTYSYEGQQATVRMDQKPEGDKLPVINGQVVTQTASAAGAGNTQ
jgi:uncharacterized protein YcfJ